MKFFFVILFLFFTCLKQTTCADVLIKPYKKQYSWKSEWSFSLREELKKNEYRETPLAFLNNEIDEEDLKELNCVGYNSASYEDKMDFWIVFFSALTRAESAFNEKVVSPKSRGQRNYGLLQLAKQTAINECKIITPDKNVLNAQDNLKCGIHLMHWQLLGAPDRAGKKKRPDLAGQLFGKRIFQWGPLRQNDRRGRALLINWFKDHLDQLSFCH
jgi:hypothetical protein